MINLIADLVIRVGGCFRLPFCFSFGFILDLASMAGPEFRVGFGLILDLSCMAGPEFRVDFALLEAQPGFRALSSNLGVRFRVLFFCIAHAQGWSSCGQQLPRLG